MDLTKQTRSRMRMLMAQFFRWRPKWEALEQELKLAQSWSEELEAKLHAETDRSRKMLLRKRCALTREFQQQIEREMREITALRQSLSPLLEALSARQQEILSRRYERGQSWVQIGMIMGCDESFARRLERRALDEMARSLLFTTENLSCKISSSGV